MGTAARLLLWMGLLVAALLASSGEAERGAGEPAGVAVTRRRQAYATIMYMGTPRDYEFYVATRVLIRSLAKLKVDADLVVIASKDVPRRWVQAL